MSGPPSALSCRHRVRPRRLRSGGCGAGMERRGCAAHSPGGRPGGSGKAPGAAGGGNGGQRLPGDGILSGEIPQKGMEVAMGDPRDPLPPFQHFLGWRSHSVEPPGAPAAAHGQDSCVTDQAELLGDPRDPLPLPHRPLGPRDGSSIPKSAGMVGEDPMCPLHPSLGVFAEESHPQAALGAPGGPRAGTAPTQTQPVPSGRGSRGSGRARARLQL